MTYLILVNLSLILFFALYLSLLKQLTFFQWNRMYLLCALVVSLLLPLVQGLDLSNHRAVYQPLVITEFMMIEAGEGVEINGKQHSWQLMDICHAIYSTGVLLMLCWLGFRIYRSYRYFEQAASKGRSFSFFNRMAVASDLHDRDVITAHEHIHIQQRHSYDVLLLELIWAFNWFNPIFYFYLKELKFQHECIADAYCAKNKVQYAELLVATAMGTSQDRLLHEFSNKSFLKRRIMMLFKNKSQKINYSKYLLFLPAVLVLSGIALAFNPSVKHVPVPIPTIGDTLEQQPIAEEHTSLDEHPKHEMRNGRIVLKGKSGQGEHTVTTTNPTGDPQEQQDHEDNVFTAVEINPEPVGGLNAFRVWLGNNYHYPQAAIDAGVKGRIVVSFVVEKDGQLSSFKIVEDLGYETGEAAIETLQKAESWVPGKQNGRKVRVAYTLPIQLNLAP